MTTDTPNERRKAELDALLLKLPGVSARMINGLEAYDRGKKFDARCFRVASDKALGETRADILRLMRTPRG